MITNLSCLMIMHDVRLHITKGSETRQGILRGFLTFRWKIPLSSGLPWKARVTVYCEYLITSKLKVKERGGLESVYGHVLSKEPEYTTWKVPGHGIGHFTTINWLHNIYNWSDMNRISPFSSFILGMYHIGDAGIVSLDCYFFILYV